MGCLFLCLGAKNGGKKVKRIANVPTSQSQPGIDEVIEALSLVKSNISISDAMESNCCSKEDVVTINDVLTTSLVGDSFEKEKGKEPQEGGDHLIDGNNEMLMEEESADSLFSLPINSRKQVQEVEKGEEEVTSPMTVRVPPDEEGRRSKSVLFPIENLNQCKVKLKALPTFEDESKENVEVGSDLKPLSPNVKQTKNGDGDISMETSLSSWLVEPETSSVSKCTSDISGEKTPCSHDQRANSESLISDGVRESAKLPTTTRSQKLRHNILGTVGSYWSSTGQATNSDSGSSAKAVQCKMSVNKENERPHLESAPFALRLDMAT